MLYEQIFNPLVDELFEKSTLANQGQRRPERPS